MKANQQVKPVIDLKARTVTFEVKGRESLVLHMDLVHPANKEHAAYVGFAQVRVVDAAAVGLEDDDGNIIPEEERIDAKHANMARLIAHYETGTPEWTLRGESTGGGARSITVEAIARVKGVEYAEAREMVKRHAEAVCKGDTKKALANLRQSAKVLEAMAQIRAERAPKPRADADALLDEMK